MVKYKVVLSASYNIEADGEDDAVNEARNELADEMCECGVPATIDSLALIRQIFGSNAEEIVGNYIEPSNVFSIDKSAKRVDKRMLETFGGELEKKGWRKKK